MGRSWFQFGDGSAPGSAVQWGKATGEEKCLTRPVFHASMDSETLTRGGCICYGDTLKPICTDPIRSICWLAWFNLG